MTKMLFREIADMRQFADQEFHDDAAVSRGDAI
jgi:hypothetical protein